MLTTLLMMTASLPLGGLEPIPNEPSAVLAAVDQEAYDLMVEAYDAAYETWQKKVKAAKEAKDKEARKALRAAPPALDYWPRFERLAEKGEGQALLWLATHVRDAGIKTTKRGEVLTPLFEGMVEKHVDEDWFEEVPALIYKERRYIGEESALALLVRVDKGCEEDEVRADALLQQYKIHSKGDSEEAKASAEALLTRLTEEFGDTAAGMKALATAMQGKTEVGKEAPDFTGKTIDGFEFKLSEYRGKVVMLDFYGFW